MNLVVLLGRLTKDPEIIYKSGENEQSYKYCIFSIAVNRGDKSMFFPCVVYGDKAETLKKYTQKGSQIAIKGFLRNINKNGKNYTDVVVTDINFIQDVMKQKNIEIEKDEQGNFIGIRKEDNTQDNTQEKNKEATEEFQTVEEDLFLEEINL